MGKPDPRFDEEFNATRRPELREDNDDEIVFDEDVDECDEDDYGDDEAI